MSNIVLPYIYLQNITSGFTELIEKVNISQMHTHNKYISKLLRYNDLQLRIK